MERQVVVGCLFVLLAAFCTGTVAGTSGAGDSGFLAQPDGFDQTTFEITVLENGSARWEIKHHRRLANDTERRQFESFASTFEENETDLYRNFVARASSLTAIGTNATGREMDAKAFDRDAYTNVTTSFDDRGTVELSFTWTNFARSTGDRVVVGDVFDGNFYIGPNQAIVFERGPNVQFIQTRPEPTSQTQPDSLAKSQSVTWEGERQFAPQRPYIVLEPRSNETATQATGGTEATETATTPGGPPANSGNDRMLWLVGILIIVIGVSSAVAYRSGTVSLPNRGDKGETETAGQSTDSPQSSSTNQTPIPDEELLSDNDRVIKLLEESGGRMKQVNIVEETDWSKSKVSMLLSDMEDEGEISKLRVGRENIISLAGQEPDAAGSPFDDEE